MKKHPGGYGCIRPTLYPGRMPVPGRGQPLHRDRGECTKKRRAAKRLLFFLLEAPPGLEPGVRDLQSRALPLGYGAIYGICGRERPQILFVERLTRLELATSTLARWRSTG